MKFMMKLLLIKINQLFVQLLFKVFKYLIIEVFNLFQKVHLQGFLQLLQAFNFLNPKMNHLKSHWIT